MSRWIYRLVPTRPGMLAAPTPEEEMAMAEHADYLDALTAAGILLLAGRSEHGGAPGITIFEAPDEASARAVSQTDPAVSAGVMSAELYPYAVDVPGGD
ncbi:YciI family protein [Microbacterium sp. 1P10UB]|uniref:YciI family protein n=1 Tax=unclassified Microbacterium TaxID=2609290 RepID=UPI0039A256DD